MCDERDNTLPSHHLDTYQEIFAHQKKITISSGHYLPSYKNQQCFIFDRGRKHTI